jgi:hypothetical protein
MSEFPNIVILNIVILVFSGAKPCSLVDRYKHFESEVLSIALTIISYTYQICISFP